MNDLLILPVITERIRKELDDPAADSTAPNLGTLTEFNRLNFEPVAVNHKRSADHE